MSNVKDKDVFIIHSKCHEQERAVAEFIANLLNRATYSTYLYVDWTSTVTRKSYSYTNGDEFDPERYALGEPSMLAIS